jgi:hypothetical protein
MTALKLRLVSLRKWKHRFSVSDSSFSSRWWTGTCQTFLRENAPWQLSAEQNQREKGDCEEPRRLKLELTIE